MREKKNKCIILFFSFEFYANKIVWIFVFISIWSVYSVYVPIEYGKYPYPYPYPGYVYVGKCKYKSTVDELKDYWITFKDTFSRSYKEILESEKIIVERPVPIAVPGKKD